MNTKKKSHKIIAILLLALAIALIGSGIVLYRHFPEIKYYANAVVTRLKPKNLPKKTDDLELTDSTLQELLQMPGVTYDQSMMLVNTTHKLSSDFTPDTGEYKDSDVVMNNCLMEAYAQIAEAVNEQFDEKLYIRSAYRSAKEQQEQIDERGTAIATAVGASEHQAGLGLDVYVPYYAGAAFIQDPAGQWVNEHCADYGFIIRYPTYGQGDTGISYEPWHLRYVGFPHAQVIMDNALTLERYVASFEVGAYYRYGDYLISRQESDALRIPGTFSSAVISPDNCGNYFCTFLLTDDQ
jgi:LAS superfamily LD-carboxypeptidase LdcB